MMLNIGDWALCGCGCGSIAQIRGYIYFRGSHSHYKVIDPWDHVEFLISGEATLFVPAVQRIL